MRVFLLTGPQEFFQSDVVKPDGFFPHGEGFWSSAFTPRSVLSFPNKTRKAPFDFPWRNKSHPISAFFPPLASFPLKKSTFNFCGKPVPPPSAPVGFRFFWAKLTILVSLKWSICASREDAQDAQCGASLLYCKTPPVIGTHHIPG